MGAADPVLVIAVVDIGQALEARGQSLTHGRPPLEAGAPRIWATRRLQHAVVREELHDPIEVIRVERRDELLQSSIRIGSHAGHYE